MTRSFRKAPGGESQASEPGRDATKCCSLYSLCARCWGWWWEGLRDAQGCSGLFAMGAGQDAEDLAI